MSHARGPSAPPPLVRFHGAAMHFCGFLTLRELVSLCLTSREVRALVLSRGLEGGSARHDAEMLLHVDSDEVALMPTVHAIIAACVRVRLVFAPRVSDAGFVAIGSLLSSTTTMPVVHVEANRCAELSNVGVEAFASSGLTGISLSAVWRVTDAALTALFTHCPKLASVNVSRCYRVSDASIQHAQGLKHLDLSRCVNVCNRDTYLALAARNPDLESLKLSGMANVGALDDAFQCITFPNLRALDLESVAITDATLACVQRVAPRLQQLNLSRCVCLTNLSVLGGAILAQLTKLDVSGTIFFSAPNDADTDEDGEDEESANRGLHPDYLALRGAKELRELDVRRTAFSDQGLRHSVVGHLPHVQRLVLTGTRVSDEGLVRAYSNATTTSPSCCREVLLGECTRIKGARGLLALAEACPNIRTLQFPPHARNDTVLAVTSKLPALESVDVSRAHSVSDAGVLPLLQRASLRTLRVDETSVSDAVLRQASRSPSLSKLTAYGCQETTDHGFEELNRYSRSLQSIMDKEGKMIRCPCCAWMRSSSSSSPMGGGGECVPFSSRSAKGSSSFGKGAESGSEFFGRFMYMEAPFLIAAVVVCAML